MPQSRENRPKIREEIGQSEEDGNEVSESNVIYCCFPHGCENNKPIKIDNPGTAVRVICNNENCKEGQLMHKKCFNHWEEQVLAYLRSTGRARSWSEKQRIHNLWTKKGYDLAFKACDCKCGKGHLRKDLDYVPKNEDQPEEVATKKKNRKKKKNDKPSIGKLVAILQEKPPSAHNSQHQQPRARTSSLSSTGSSPPSSLDSPATPSHSTMGKRSKFDFSENRQQRSQSSTSATRGTTPATRGIFQHRIDFSAFSSLPRHKQNPYHIKMADDGIHGHDETRNFILSNLSGRHIGSVSCVLCNTKLQVFDRYPLIDGTFFLSPLQYTPGCIQVRFETRNQFLCAICLNCLEGSVVVQCKFCQSVWKGDSHILGTMYAYDILAAMACCEERLQCKNCDNPIITLGEGGLHFFSQYSHKVTCAECEISDFHFVKGFDTYHIYSRWH